MEPQLEEIVALLERIPAALDALLRELPDAWTMRNEGGESWSVFDVVGHLNHGELTDWIPRAKWILEFGESQPFPPFDRTGHAKESEGRSLGHLLEEFARLRTGSLTELKRLELSDEQLELKGVHPALGPVTLKQLLATWVVHDMTHLHQIARVMAFQGREAVGPWSAYLGVLKCDGHSLG